jgi:hypothetical protein
MRNFNALAGNPDNDNSRYCLARPGELYLIYLPGGGASELDLSGAARSFTVHWFNPRAGGGLQTGRIAEVKGPGKVNLGPPPAEADQDWVAVVKAR